MFAKVILRLIYRIVLLRLALVVLRKLGVPNIFHPKPSGITGRIATYGMDKK